LSLVSNTHYAYEPKRQQHKSNSNSSINILKSTQLIKESLAENNKPLKLFGRCPKQNHTTKTPHNFCFF